MDSDLNTQLAVSRMGNSQGSIQTALLKKTNEAEMAVVATLTEAVLAPPPPGQGGKVDKLA
ncbi:MAG TPA: hypothetical protein VL147_23660 [Devosia sp.]|nr:hypothetical protein [Devosia sp.]